jgi:signal transduction histidine kinase
MNRIYESLSSVRLLSKSYTFKFLFIAFLGIHIPLIGLVVFVVFRPDNLSAFSVLLLTLLLTLAATGITLFILNGLLSPLRRSRRALEDYRGKRLLPQLPTEFKDEAGLLMQNIQVTIHELNDLLDEKKDLTALLSHDLRIPLRNVKTFSKLLQKTDEWESVREIGEMIRHSAEEQTKLLEDILEMLRQDHLFFGTAQSVKMPVSKIIDETISSFEPVAAGKNILLTKHVMEDLTVNVQPELFQQVLKNLASNAVKFSYDGSQIAFSAYKKEGKTFIEVVDSGMGFDPEVAERLFDRFTKKGRKGTAGEPSTGIGLYLSRKIIRHHQGELMGQSKGAGKGSVFSICLS